MPQSYWHLTGNLWALALSTVIALFLPDFGPTERMDGGVGVVIRATMAVPVVFSLMYWTGRLIINLTEKLKKWWLMSIITAGIEQGIRDVAERRAKDMAKDIAKNMAEDIAKNMAKDMVEAEREEVKQFMRSKGVSDEDIDAFFRRVSDQD
ncbi:MAG: hypothetical protein F4X66_00745 [Chloroflexi bacterium]|nr:hypothetical protein [Chloroflexota bacterium]MYE41950.1 hypothetical protein [Chloroflexota bacterium]